MSDASLQGCRILIVEDEFLLADELERRLGDLGAVILGPVGTVADALEQIAAGQQIDGAILDVNLDGESIFPAAELLIERHTPFIFTTGYERSAIPDRFAEVICCEKPVVLHKITEAIRQAIGRDRTVRLRSHAAGIDFSLPHNPVD